MAARLVRWMPLAFVCGALALVARRAAQPINDPDDWWHLRLGNDLIAQRSLSTPQHWSSFATLGWVPTEPLPEIVSAYVQRWFGLPGLSVLFCVAGVLVVVAVHVTNRREATLLPAAVATVFVVLAGSGSLTSRPQLVSFALLPVVLAAWLQTERDLRPRWWLVPLVWLWSLCHGFWIFGVALGFLFVVGIALSRRADLRTLARLVAVAAASFAVVALNPVGLGVLEAPFAVQSTSQYIREWQRTDLLSARPLAAIVMIVGTAVIWAVTRQGVTWPRVLLLLSAAFLLWYAARLVVVGGLVAGPLFANALDILVARSDNDTERERRLTPSELGTIGVAALLCVLAVAAVAPSVADTPEDVPLGLDVQLDALPPGTPVFNTYRLGGWIAWRHPDLNQYIDGLITPYSVPHVRDYVRIEATDPGWYRLLLASKAPVALLGADSALAAALEVKGWASEGTSHGYVLLRRPT
jgi:hypothetical protein